MIQFVLLSMQHTVVLSPPNQAAMFSSVHDKFLGFFPIKLTHTSRLSVIQQSWSGINSNIKALKEDSLCQCNICSISGNTTVVILHRHEDVAIIAPVCGPRVLDEPVWLSIQGAISHCKHSMVQIIHSVPWKTEPASYVVVSVKDSI